MGQTTSSRGLSRFTEVNSPPDNVPLPTDYFNEPLGSLEESLKGLHSRLEDLERHITKAKSKCHYPNGNNLSRDESAAIYLYTMEWESSGDSLYLIFNRDLRTKDRSRMRVWLAFLRLLMTALGKIPSMKVDVYRGLRDDVSGDYTEGKEFVWASATSCTRSLNVAHNFFASSNGSGTMFHIEATTGKDISSFSAYQLEEEVLLRPGTRLRVTRGATPENIDGKKVPIIHLKEI